VFEDAVRVVVVHGQWAAVSVQVRDRIEVTMPDGSVECYEAVANVVNAPSFGDPGWSPIRRDCR
jgi:hypothetical protein